MELGEIYIQTEEGTAVLEVKNDKSQQVTLIVQDKVGKPCLEQERVLVEGKQSLSFPISDLKLGTYFVWLHSGNETRMSSFNISPINEPNSKSSKNPLQSLNFFSW